MLQIIGISVMLGLACAIVECVRRHPEFLKEVVVVSTISLGFFALIGLVQFVAWNLFGLMSLFDFTFLNGWLGTRVWRDPGSMGALSRVNSLAAEPTHFARYLGLAAGWSLIRLGFCGAELKSAIAPLVPAWAAVSVVLGFFAALSINGWVLFCVVLVLLFFWTRRVASRYIIGAFTTLGFLAVAFAATLTFSGSAISEKLQTAVLVFDDRSLGQFESKQISALAIASNVAVARQNLNQRPLLGTGVGSHPLAYEKYAPNYAVIHKSLEHLNAEDAASLFVRLVSEVGILGTVTFVGGIMWLLFRAGSQVHLGATFGSVDREMLAISVGVVASAGGLFVMYLVRVGHYYDPIFWVAIGLVVGSRSCIRRPRRVARRCLLATKVMAS